MTITAGADVRFDFEGVLALCRMLWSLADELDALRTSRSAAAGTALTSWEGPFGVEFKARANDETTSAVRIAEGLRSDATGWAQAWKTAMDEANRRRWARHHLAWQQDQSWLDGLFGSTDPTPNPEPVGQPRPPGFAPTGTLVNL